MKNLQEFARRINRSDYALDSGCRSSVRRVPFARLPGPLDDRVIGQGIDADRVLQQAQEEKTSPSSPATVVAEAELVQVVGRLKAVQLATHLCRLTCGVA